MADAYEYELLHEHLRSRYLPEIETLLHGPLSAKTEHPQLVRVRDCLSRARDVLGKQVPRLKLGELREMQKDLESLTILNGSSQPTSTGKVNPLPAEQACNPKAAGAGGSKTSCIDPRMMLAGAALLRQLRDTGEAHCDEGRRPVFMDGLEDDTGDSNEEVAEARARAAEASADVDTVAVLKSLRLLMYSFGDAAHPRRSSSIVALGGILAWQRSAVHAAASAARPSQGSRLAGNALSVDDCMEQLRTMYPADWDALRRAARTRELERAADNAEEAGAAVTATLSVDEAPASASAAPSALLVNQAAMVSVDERRYFEHERTAAMHVEEYTAFAAARASRFASVHFARLTARNLQGIATMHVSRAPPGNSLQFLAKLCLAQLRLLVEHANREAHGGVLVHAVKPLSRAQYCRARCALLAKAKPSMPVTSKPGPSTMGSAGAPRAQMKVQCTVTASEDETGITKETRNLSMVCPSCGQQCAWQMSSFDRTEAVHVRCNRCQELATVRVPPCRMSSTVTGVKRPHQ